MMSLSIDALQKEAIELLENLIRCPSPSGKEKGTADIIADFAESRGMPYQRKHNNIMVTQADFDPQKTTILLNSHHDTISPGNGWETDPYQPVTLDGRLTGLGSNDAGGSLVTLLAVFRHYFLVKDLRYNVVFLATAEEESSGALGMNAMLEDLAYVDFAIVGEPTGMEMAVAEKGLIVMECTTRGKTGHAARDTGINAIYEAFDDIRWLRSYQYPRESEMLGPVKMTVTMIEAGSQHNVIPDICRFTIDIRSTDVYTNDEIVGIIRKHIRSEISKCSLRLNPSFIERDHVLVKAARELGIPLFGSPTLSDQALLPMPSVKIGPGRSERSHTPNEYIYTAEIRNGIETYIKLLDKIL